jgi:hypothetical protein
MFDERECNETYCPPAPLEESTLVARGRSAIRARLSRSSKHGAVTACLTTPSGRSVAATTSRHFKKRLVWMARPHASTIVGRPSVSHPGAGESERHDEQRAGERTHEQKDPDLTCDGNDTAR